MTLESSESMFRYPFFRNVLLLLAVLIAPAFGAAKTILVFGDSLSAAYNLSKEQGWVHLMGEKLAKETCWFFCSFFIFYSGG
jgi:hypothetical protein